MNDIPSMNKNPLSVQKIDEDFEFDMTDMNYDNDGQNININHKVIRHTGLNLDFEVIPNTNSVDSSNDQFSFGSVKGSRDFDKGVKSSSAIKSKNDIDKKELDLNNLNSRSSTNKKNQNNQQHKFKLDLNKISLEKDGAVRESPKAENEHD